MIILEVIGAVLWILLVLFWLFSAFRAKKSVRGMGWWGRELAIRVVLIVIVIIFVRIGVLSPGSSVVDFFHYQAPVTTSTDILLGLVGVILIAAGVAFAIWARVNLGTNWGMPMTLKKDPQLVTSGPYKLVRHPIYTGFILAAFGSVFLYGTIWLLILIFMGIYFVYSAKREEGIMTKQFPNEYPEYMKRTKMMIPFVL